MSHFAVVAPTYPSHFSALQALGLALVERGHQVTFMQQHGVAGWLDDPRIGFVGLGPQARGEADVAQTLHLAGRTGNPWHLYRLIRQMADNSALLCEHLPDALRKHQVDALICDQMAPAGALIAEALHLPSVSVACALPVNREAGIPLPVVPFAAGTDARALRLQAGSERVHDGLMTPLSKVLMRACRHHGLAPRGQLHAFLSPLLQLSQMPAGLDFPRQHWPAHAHALGPLRRTTREAPGTWPISAERPLVFASLGTLQGHRFDLFERIASACQHLEVQLLLAHCGGLDAQQQARLHARGATFVTDFAPQQWAVRRADVVISHGGLNTVLDAAVAGTPQLVLPIAFDQPGVAARVEHHRFGLRLPHRASRARIAQALNELLQAPAGRFRSLAEDSAALDGAQRGAQLIEQALASGRAVLNEEATCASI